MNTIIMSETQGTDCAAKQELPTTSSIVPDEACFPDKGITFVKSESMDSPHSTGQHDAPHSTTACWHAMKDDTYLKANQTRALDSIGVSDHAAWSRYKSLKKNPDSATGKSLYSQPIKVEINDEEAEWEIRQCKAANSKFLAEITTDGDHGDKVNTSSQASNYQYTGLQQPRTGSCGKATGSKRKASKPSRTTVSHQDSSSEGSETVESSGQTRSLEDIVHPSTTLTAKKIKRLDLIISEVRKNLELNPVYPKECIPEVKDTNVNEVLQSCLVDSSTHDEKGKKQAVKKSKKDKGTIWSDTINGKKERFKCLTCNKGFYYMSYLRKHSLTHVTTKDFICQICNKAFSQRSHLQTHMRVHNDEKMFSCPLCSKGFNHKTSLNIHLRVHSGERPFVCDICGKDFPRKNTLKNHKLSHTSEKPYLCTTCGKSFNRRYILQRHVMIHTGIRPYKCSTCGQAFHQQGDLVKHIRLHTGEKPYTCMTCGKSFNQSSDMYKHMRTHTGENKPHKCTMCSKSYTKGIYLKQHLLKKHNCIYSCSVCKEGFETVEELQAHTIAFKLQCKRNKPLIDNYPIIQGDEETLGGPSEASQSVDVNESDMGDYSQMSYDGLFSCPYCDKEFNNEDMLDDHMIEHDKSDDPSMGDNSDEDQ